MKRVKITSILLAIYCQVVLLSSCKSGGPGVPHVQGTWDEPLACDSAPQRVLEAFDSAVRFHPYEIMNDTVNNVCVMAIGEVSTAGKVEHTPTEGFGIEVVRGSITTFFPHIKHVRQPMAKYDNATQTLWLASSAAEGTGVQVEWLYKIRFHENDSAYIARVINPYDLQQQLYERLCYSVEGEQVKLYDGERLIWEGTNTQTDMGGLDSEQPLWIGEQMVYDLSTTTPSLLVKPGGKFTTGLVLTYDDMPTLTAPLKMAAHGSASIDDVEQIVFPFEGTYLDEDNHEPSLFISYRRSDGRYDVEIGIFRLTTLDDGIGTMGDSGLRFTATDASGNPIGGIITLKGDTATVTFTDSTWPLLNNGSQFIYTREMEQY